MAAVVPLFYLHTAPEILAVPETVSISGSIEPHSTRVSLFNIPSLEVSSRRAVITLVLSGVTMQSKVVSDQDIATYSASLYDTFNPAMLGMIYVHPLAGSIRTELLQRLNTPDYEVIEVDGDFPEPTVGQRTVHISDDAMLKVPAREIARHFTSVFSTAATIVAPGIATFFNYTATVATSYIALSDYEHFVLGSNLAGADASLLNSVTLLQQGDVYQPPIKMTSTGWTVFGVLWGVMAIVLVISIGTAYWWYLAQYL